MKKIKIYKCLKELNNIGHTSAVEKSFKEEDYTGPKDTTEKLISFYNEYNKNNILEYLEKEGYIHYKCETPYISFKGLSFIKNNNKMTCFFLDYDLLITFIIDLALFIIGGFLIEYGFKKYIFGGEFGCELGNMAFVTIPISMFVIGFLGIIGFLLEILESRKYSVASISKPKYIFEGRFMGVLEGRLIGSLVIGLGFWPIWMIILPVICKLNKLFS